MNKQFRYSLIILTIVLSFACSIQKTTVPNTPEAKSSTEAPLAEHLSSDLQIQPIASNDNVVFYGGIKGGVSYGIGTGIYSASTINQGFTCLTCEIIIDTTIVSPNYYIHPNLSSDNNTLAISGSVIGENDLEQMYGLWLINLHKGEVYIPNIEEYGGFINPSWTPDGKRIAYTNGGTIRILDIESQKLIFSEKPDDLKNLSEATNEYIPNAHVETYFSWSPDGTQLLYDSDSNYIVQINIDERTATILQPNESIIDFDYLHFTYPTWSPTGKEILFVSDMAERPTGITWEELLYQFDYASEWRDYQVNVLDLFIMSTDSGEQICLTCDLDNSPSWSIFPTWSPDGNQIAFFGYDFSQLPESFLSINIYDLNRKDIKTIFQVATPIITRHETGPPRWSDQGDQLVFSAPNNDDYAVYVINADGSDLKLLASESGKDFTFPQWIEGY